MPQEAIELRSTIAGLNSTVGDLKIVVAELKVTVGEMRGRDQEDRDAAKDDRIRIDKLEGWKNKVNGGFAVVSAGWLALAGVLLMRILKLI